MVQSGLSSAIRSSSIRLISADAMFRFPAVAFSIDWATVLLPQSTGLTVGSAAVQARTRLRNSAAVFFVKIMPAREHRHEFFAIM